MTSALTLGGGLLLGWIIFSTDNFESHDHTTMVSEEEVWTCSMHPQIRSKEPGDCPICGMDLVELEDQSKDGIDPRAVSMSTTAMQLANVSTAIVGQGEAQKIILLNGKVAVDERRIYSQTAHFPGRIERLAMNFEGDYVSRGTTIANLYSPELVTAQEELIEAYKIRSSQPNLYAASRRKLKNWKITDDQIDAIISNPQSRFSFPVSADHSGYVTDLRVKLGDHINQGETMYSVADLSQVWVQFELYERDLSLVNKNDSVSFTVASIPGKTFAGKIDYIDPVINPNTRVSKARVVISNKDLTLKPEMFVSGSLKSSISISEGELTVPKSAVMWTGKRSVVYVKLQSDQGTHFVLREITLGPSLGENFMVVDGLAAGEEIAVHGTFSIDAAAQLAGKPSMMSPQGGDAVTDPNHEMNHDTTPNGQAQHQMSKQLKVNESSQVFESDPEFRKQLQAVFAAYLPVKDALIESDVKTTRAEALSLKTAIDKVDMKLVKDDAHTEWMKDLKVLLVATEGLLNEKGLEQIRTMLSPLSDQLFHTLKKYQVAVAGYRQYCPMAFDFKGAFWLSDSEEILNPYFGDEMLTCGSVEEELD